MMKKNLPKFSIIICLYVITERFFDDLKKFINLNYPNFEIIIICEKKIKLNFIFLPIKIIRINKKRISLGEKRDIGIKYAKGKFCAFIDDDAYPDQDWLSNAKKIFSDNELIGAVGGPNVTPPDEPFWPRIGGFIYESYCTSGEAQPRFLPGKRRGVLELQGVNLIVRKSILKRIGGFNSRLYSGDDSKICAKIRSYGYKIIYDPKVVVYHHRRSFPRSHLNQVKNIGMHRGFFVKAYPETSSPFYFLPTILSIGFFMGLIFSFFYKEIRILYLFLLIIFFLTGYLSIVKRAGIFKSFIVTVGIMATHITYGIFFIRGFLLSDVERR